MSQILSSKAISSSSKLFSIDRIRIMDKRNKEHGSGLECLIPERIGKRLHQSIHHGFSNFLWRGYEYEIVSDYINEMKRLEYIKNSLETWDPYYSDFISNLFESFYKTMKAERSSVSMNEAKFDPDSIKIEDSSQKFILKKLRIACLTVCILSTVSYTSVCGTSLCKQFL